jgi:hypothetical protein
MSATTSLHNRIAYLLPYGGTLSTRYDKQMLPDELNIVLVRHLFFSKDRNWFAMFDLHVRFDTWSRFPTPHDGASTDAWRTFQWLEGTTAQTNTTGPLEVVVRHQFHDTKHLRQQPLTLYAGYRTLRYHIWSKRAKKIGEHARKARKLLTFFSTKNTVRFRRTTQITLQNTVALPPMIRRC